MKCPVCEGGLVRKKVEFKFGDISLGEFEADKCTKCGEEFFTEKSSDEIDKKAKQLGLWGISSKTTIGYSGNSLIVRIPKEISNFMKLKKGGEVALYPEGKDRLIIEIKD
jgi:YgiT-type zinc finger domain-containing protein